MESLLGKNIEELQEIAQKLGMPKFTAKQIADWLYKKKVSSISEMTNLSKKNRELLEKEYEVGRNTYCKVQESVDGTKKYLFATANKKFIETAYIPETSRKTLCVSSQVGCKMGCVFCLTGKQGFQNNLPALEIVNQLLSIDESESITNIVFMGMGEPLDNLPGVLKAIEILTSEWGLAMSPRRITVSTIGILPAMKTFLESTECHLAVSLHSPFNEERKNLMPVEMVYPLDQIIDELRNYNWRGQRRISFEYIMFDGVNDSLKHASALVKLLNGFRCRLNLIRFHSFEGTPLKTSPDKKIEEFKEFLNSKGVLTTIRSSRGEDIYAACGMLSTKKLLKEEDLEY